MYVYMCITAFMIFLQSETLSNTFNYLLCYFVLVTVWKSIKFGDLEELHVYTCKCNCLLRYQNLLAMAEYQTFKNNLNILMEIVPFVSHKLYHMYMYIYYILHVHVYC